MNIYHESGLRQFCEELLTRIGMAEENAKVVADSLIQANLEGIDSHGISRLPIYVKRFMDKRITLNPSIQMTKMTPSILIVDGDHGLGHIVSYYAIKEAIGMSKENGMTAIAIKNSNHFGTASYFCQLACEQNLACIALTNSPPGIAPWGGKEAFFGTNPIAFGFPTGTDQPVIIDLSTSIVARGKIILAAKQGNRIPDDWAIDDEGKPTNDPEAALRGSLLPIGGAKGSALALAVEILTGVLTGSAFGPHVKNIYDDRETEYAKVGHFFILMDIEKFMELNMFFASIQNLLDEMKSVSKAEGTKEIRYPGERRKKDSEKKRKEGILLSSSVEMELLEIGSKYNVNFPPPLTLQKIK
ncbi:MAG TPA: Ldh family oxidoreductase [Bacillus sp. (in: firmicutes)]|uniref:Ldh family oxidoreductase n=1 Tax=Bacillus litorisediminis TaxID=2922713 RepID=UPI001FABA3FC|nr:Ldh family oxidoreductase [Bacillus litorisediminis]HWO76171.1 Ldh family oxidoreductase [Bacillus sp. (in: firmicutes)]